MIEIIAAVGIMAVGLIAILSLFPAGMKMSQRATYSTQATVYGQSVLEEIRMAIAEGKDFDTEINNNGSGWFNFGGLDPAPGQPKPEYPYDSRFLYTVRFEDQNANSDVPDANNLQRVTVTFYWPVDAQKQQQLSFITHIYP